MATSLTPSFYSLPEDSQLGLRDQICEMISSAITSRSLSPDTRLPSCRELAQQLGVSRNTVFAAYNRLIDIDLVVARNRSGHYVNPDIQSLLEQTSRSIINHNNDQDKSSVPIKFEPLELVPVVNPLNWTSYPYPFIYNQIDPNLFPVDSWRECTRLALGRTQMPAWRDDSVESDSPQLIEQLRYRLLSTRGIYANDDEILITLGAQNALFIIGSVFSSHNKSIAIENPGFPGARNAFKLTGNTMVGVPVDEEGLNVSAIPTDCHLVFTTPSHQFPTMVTMSLQRRKQLLEAANRKNFLIIEDDYEAEMNFFDTHTPPLRSLDENNRVIYVGSLSKTVSPGIRIGFMVAHRDIIHQARIVRGAMMRHPPTIVQEVVALFFRLGHYDAHLQKIERRYKKRWQVMYNAITQHLGMLHQNQPKGGTSFWLRGPDGFNATKLGEQLRTKGVLIDIGETFYLNNAQHSFRLGFAFVPMKKLEQGIQIIAEEVNNMLG